MKTVSLTLPLTKEQLLSLDAGDKIILSGTVYTARDAAHRRIAGLLEQKKELPFSLSGAAIYYTGPAPAKDTEIIGVCGPTSSTRMDTYTPLFIEHGLSVMIGKGKRAQYVVDAMKGRAVYLLAVGGAAVYYRQFVTECEIAAYPELDSEAVRRLKIAEMPLIVGIDAKGNSILR